MDEKEQKEFKETVDFFKDLGLNLPDSIVYAYELFKFKREIVK